MDIRARWGLNYAIDCWFSSSGGEASKWKIKTVAENARRVGLGIPSIFG